MLTWSESVEALKKVEQSVVNRRATFTLHFDVFAKSSLWKTLPSMHQVLPVLRCCPVALPYAGTELIIYVLHVEENNLSCTAAAERLCP